jgi:hypothetical protein
MHQVQFYKELAHRFTTPNLTANTTYKVRCEGTVCARVPLWMLFPEYTTRLYANKNATVMTVNTDVVLETYD